ncbi:MAG: hypothetical protein OHK0015_11040 [Chloroflexi bacterium OHK40]
MPEALIGLLQLLVVVGAAHGAGWIAGRLGQPRVIGEMAAGLLLGPSLLGRLAPGVSATLFGPQALDGLQALSQLGLLLFIFLVGLELQPQQLHQRRRLVLALTLSSTLVPFVAGVGVGAALVPSIGGPQMAPWQVALFLGVALSITAFPVLARILDERGLLRSPLGGLAIVCAAAADVLAWCALAAVVLLVQATAPGASLWLMLGGGALFVLVMLRLGRPLAARLLRLPRDGVLDNGRLAAIVLALIAAAALTEWLGIHALFGAFLAGTMMPRHPALSHQIHAKLEGLTTALLLPLFFASVGLRADIGLIQGGPLLLAAGLIVAVAVVGKLSGATLAARAGGMGWRAALGFGALMNTRGLMELVVAGVGLEIGVLSPAGFTILVLVALVTTCMTGPLLDLLRITPPPAAARDDTPLVVPIPAPDRVKS